MIKCLSIKPFMHHILYHIPLEGERGKIGFLFFLIKNKKKRYKRGALRCTKKINCLTSCQIYLSMNLLQVIEYLMVFS